MSRVRISSSAPRIPVRQAPAFTAVSPSKAAPRELLFLCPRLARRPQAECAILLDHRRSHLPAPRNHAADTVGKWNDPAESTSLARDSTAHIRTLKDCWTRNQGTEAPLLARQHWEASPPRPIICPFTRMWLARRFSGANEYCSAKITLSNVIWIAYFSSGLIRPRQPAGANGESRNACPINHAEETH